MRLPAPSVILARRLERALARTPLAMASWSRGLGDRARARFERRHPALGHAVAEATINGVRMCGPGELWRAFIEQRFDTLSTARVRGFLRPGMVVVDVGAHIGYYTLLAADRVGRRGCVHAVEPCPANLVLLRQNVARFAAGRVIVHAIAAGQETAVRPFRATGSGDTSGFYEHPLAPTGALFDVQQLPLDERVAPPVDLVKIDVEGAELEVLSGMTGLVGASPDTAFLVEWNPACLRAAGRDPGELLAWLSDRGFHVEALDEESGSVLSSEALLQRLHAGDVPPHWFCNLWARRS
jgi:FkbM family methyltransferase